MKAYIFDFDGTLANTVEYHVKTFEDAFKEFGIDYDREKIIQNMGSFAEEIVKIAAKQDLSTSEAAKIAHRKDELFLEIAGPHMLKERAISVLKMLKTNYKLALATGSKIEPIRKIFGYNLELFDAIVSETDIKIGKPDPFIFEEAAHKLGEKPENCTVVEDAINGIIAAKRAKMQVIGIVGTFSAQELKNAGADRIIFKLDELVR